jgi:hypothetical protein
MLGFLLGVLFVTAWPGRKPAPPPVAAPVAAEARPKPAPAAPGSFTAIEAVFAEWDGYAIWDNDLTEVALWNSKTKDFSDCYEVLRSGSSYYFRSIPRLTRPVVTHGIKVNCPLEFTETEEQRQERLKTESEEIFKDLRGEK